MSVHRLANIPGFSIDRVAAAAGNDPEVLRLENMDTDLAPPAAAIAATQAAVGRDEANSYLPFTGSLELRTAVAERNSDQFIRFVFSNEPVARLAELRERVRRALLQP